MIFIKRIKFFSNIGHALKDGKRRDHNNGQKYAEDFKLQITRTVREHNARGNIYDCNGKVLAYNKLVYTVTMVDDGTYASERERQLALNSVIYHVIRKLNENGELINNELKIEIGTDGHYENIL